MINKTHTKIIETEINQAKKALGKNNLTIIIGLSGGPDSVFLLHALFQLAAQNNLILLAAHLDHGWRENSADDVEFCKQICKKLGLQLYSEHRKNLAIEFRNTGSKEDLGRRQRRSYFQQLLKEHNADLIALAHHKNDQRETFFLRLLRGTSLSGLCGMKPLTKNYFRPLLSISKNEILETLHLNNWKYKIDESNTSEEFLRNRIRKHIIPAFQACDQRFESSFDKTLTCLQEEHELLEALTTQAFNEIFIVDSKNQRNQGELKKFITLHKALQKRLLIKWLVQENAPFTPNTGYLHEMLRFLHSPRGGRHELSTQWTLYKKSRFFWLERLK